MGELLWFMLSEGILSVMFQKHTVKVHHIALQSRKKEMTDCVHSDGFLISPFLFSTKPKQVEWYYPHTG